MNIGSLSCSDNYSKSILLQVRQSVLHILMAIYSKLGESLLIMLPETIPFLAELLEGTQ